MSDFDGKKLFLAGVGEMALSENDSLITDINQREATLQHIGANFIEFKFSITKRKKKLSY